MRSIVFLIFVSFLQTSIAVSQEQKSYNLAKNLWRDQKAIWTSPFVGDNSRFKWMIPIAATSAFLLTRDNEWSQDYKPSENTIEVSNNISEIGSAYAVYGSVTGFYLLG